MKGAPILLLAGVGVAVGIAVLMTSKSAANPAAPSGPSQDPVPGPDPAPGPSPEPITACSNLRAKIKALCSSEVERLRALCRSSPGGACLELVPALEQAEALTARLEGCPPGAAESPCQEGWAALGALIGEAIPRVTAACDGASDPACVELERFRGEYAPLSAKWLAECAPSAVAKIPVPRGEIGASYSAQTVEGLQTILEYLATRSAAL